MGRSVAAIQIVVFDSRMPVADSKENAIGIRRQTGRPSRPLILSNNVYTLRCCPALVCFFCDENTLDSMKTKGVAIRREGRKGFSRLWLNIANQSRGKDLSDRAGRGLPQVRSFGKRFGECLDRTES